MESCLSMSSVKTEMPRLPSRQPTRLLQRSFAFPSKPREIISPAFLDPHQGILQVHNPRSLNPSNLGDITKSDYWTATNDSALISALSALLKGWDGSTGTWEPFRSPSLWPSTYFFLSQSGHSTLFQIKITTQSLISTSHWQSSLTEASSAASSKQRWDPETTGRGTPCPSAVTRHSTHKSLKQTQWQRTPLLESNTH